jgi:hypothetical protein
MNSSKRQARGSRWRHERGEVSRLHRAKADERKQVLELAFHGVVTGLLVALSLSGTPAESNVRPADKDALTL